MTCPLPALLCVFQMVLASGALALFGTAAALLTGYAGYHSFAASSGNGTAAAGNTSVASNVSTAGNVTGANSSIAANISTPGNVSRGVRGKLDLVRCV